MMIASAIAVSLMPHARADAFDWYAGNWCGQAGRYGIGRDGASAGDHIMCKWIGPAPSGPRLDARLDCGAFYDGGNVRMNAGKIRVQGNQRNENQLMLSFESRGFTGRQAFARC